MAPSRQAPYGFWDSPISSDLIVAQSIGLQDVLVDGDEIYWVESRPQEGGRYVPVQHAAGGQPRDLIPRAFNARTRVHEYGGGAVLVADGAVYFANMADQRLYVVAAPGEQPRALTKEFVVDWGPADDRRQAPDTVRFADFVLDRSRKRLIAVVEDHRFSYGAAPAEDVTKVKNYLAALPHDTLGDPVVLASGSDFYSSPQISPDGQQLAWLCWNHPNMPWVSSELWVGSLVEDRLEERARVAGGGEESIFQPQWSPDGRLHFISDRSGWWNLYRREQNGNITPLCPLAADFGQPQWTFGMSTYAFLSHREAVCTYGAKDGAKLLLLDLQTLAQREIPSSYTEFSAVRTTAARNGASRIVLRAGAGSIPPSIVSIDPTTHNVTTLRQPTDIQDRPVPDRPARTYRDYFSAGRRIEFPTTGQKSAFAIYYPPTNPDFAPLPGELPPLVVKCHGGPTAAASGTLDLRIQYWTSRGIAVVDVDYGGSTGYGREFRNRLHAQWGIVDVEDCAAAVRYLVGNRSVDGARTVITGGSAGGYTTLACLTYKDQAIRDVFRAGGSHYGVSDPAALARDTHKFESRYLDWLIAPYFAQDPAEQARNRAIYDERSPFKHAERITSPVAFFQGAEDKIVPPSQTDIMVAALGKKGITTQYLLFAGEQHGFRQAQNIKWALDAELYFYRNLAFTNSSNAAQFLSAQREDGITAVFFDLGDTLGVPETVQSQLTFHVFPGVLDLLANLKQAGLRLGVISNTATLRAAEMKAMLAPTGLLDVLEDSLLLFSGEEGVTKQDVRIFQRAACRASLPDAPQMCLFVGENAGERDVAKQAGWQVRSRPDEVLVNLHLPPVPADASPKVGSPRPAGRR